MNRWRRRASSYAALTLLCAGIPVGGAAAAGPPMAGGDDRDALAAAAPRLDWRDCEDGFECAEATVPLDYDEPDGKTTTVALIRLPATDRENRKGTLFVGAPGTLSGVAFLRSTGSAGYDPRLRERFDLVAFDRRGVGGSTPVRCFEDKAEAEAFYAKYPTYPTDRAELRQVARLNKEYGAKCETRAGRAPDHVSSADTARDLDLLRAAVGDTRLSYLGMSHAAYTGMIYANLFPERTGRLVLDGPQYAPALTRGGPISAPFVRSRSDVAGEEAISEFLRRCAAEGPGCAFTDGSAAELEAKYDRLIDRLDRRPVEVPWWPQPVGTDDLALITVNGVFSATTYAELGTQLQDLYAASSGTRKANPSYGNPKNDNPNYGNPDYGNPDYDNTEDAFSAVFCADLDTPPSEATTAAAARRAAKRSPRVGAFYSWYIPRCPGLDGPSADRYTGPWRPAGAAPALFMTNGYDPITDQAGVDRMARLVPGSRVLTVDGWDHVTLGTSACARSAVGDYVLDGELPAKGARCAADREPFD